MFFNFGVLNEFYAVFNEVSSRDWDAIKNNGLFSKKYLATCTQSSLEQAFDLF